MALLQGVAEAIMGAVASVADMAGMFPDLCSQGALGVVKVYGLF